RQHRQPPIGSGKGDRPEEQHHPVVGSGSERTLRKTNPRSGTGLGSREKSRIARPEAAGHPGLGGKARKRQARKARKA
ncbi:hypothetical protein PIB30_092183, partial [Stylosanthes scabra]|nr:hypothetical protein [Stylosanthes scabra]